MTRKLLTLMLMLICAMPAIAQKGLHVNELFEGHIISPERMVETLVRGKAVAKYGLTYFHSLRFKAKKNEAKSIEALILKDVSEESSLSVNRVGGLYWKINVQLKPKGNIKRLICYKYDMPDVLIIFMEGPGAVPETLEKMLQ